MAKASERDRYNYGVCTNKDKDGQICPKCESKEVQKIRKGQDFFCVECTEALRKVPPPKSPSPWKWIFIIAGIVIVLGVGGYFIWSQAIPSELKCKFLSIGCPEPSPPDDKQIPSDSEQITTDDKQTPDSIAIDETPLLLDIVSVTEVTLDNITLSLKKGDTIQLTETVDPEDATNKEVTWSSDNPTIAKVSSTGLVTAVAEKGTAKIIVTTADGEKTDTCTVTIGGEPQKPAPPVPTGITAIDGQTLSQVSLPTGWSWVAGTTPAGSPGTKKFKAKYNGNATYRAVSNVDVTVLVKEGVEAVLTKAINAFDKSNYSASFNYYIEAAGYPGGRGPSIKQNAANKFKEKAQQIMKNNQGKCNDSSKQLLDYANRLNPTTEIRNLLNKCT